MTLGFLFKKIISSLFLPVGLVLICLALALVCKRKLFIILGLVLLIIFAMPLTGTLLINVLERYDYVEASDLRQQEINNIVVLGGGVKPGQYSVYDKIPPESVLRVMEGVRLFHGLDNAFLILSWGNEEALNMKNLAIVLGVLEDKILLEDNSWDTSDQAVELGKILKNQKFALVTSAWHLPRAMLLCKKQGLDPLPVPTDFKGKNFIWNYSYFLPQAAGMRLSETALKEYLGIVHAYLF